MIHNPPLAKIARLLALLLLTSSAAAGEAADNPLIGSWLWDNAMTLRELKLPTEGSESVRNSAAQARRFVESAVQQLGSNVELTYTDQDCTEIVYDSRGNEIMRHTSAYRIVEMASGVVIVDQNGEERSKIFLQGNSFYVEVKVGDYIYKDYFTKT